MAGVQSRLQAQEASESPSASNPTATWGEAPDPRVLGFSETYEGTRADLRNVTGSA